MRPILNSPSCQRCHDPKSAAIGAIVVEKSLAPAEASVASNRNLLIVYGVVIFVLVGIVLWLLIVRLVTQPVSNLLEQMRRVQTGDLNARAAAETQDEVGELAGGFNAMVQSLDSATRELEESHQKQIQQAGKLASIGELASGIAHEIRNPLAGIGAAVEVLAEENNLNGQRTEIVAEIRQQITRLNRTLHDLLEFARLRDPEIAPCDVHGFIRPMLALVRPDAQKFHVKIEERFAADLPTISADEGQMQQALLNILLNGVQAMPSGGTLTVSTESTQRNGSEIVRIKIRDTGVGIARQHLAKIFSPFFTTKHRGTGLGLSITRTIIEKHHGTIAVDSEPGNGTTFTLELAACKPETFAPQAGAETPKEFAHAEN
jgi:signal transduction histidine kinase